MSRRSTLLPLQRNAGPISPGAVASQPPQRAGEARRSGPAPSAEGPALESSLQRAERLGFRAGQAIGGGSFGTAQGPERGLPERLQRVYSFNFPDKSSPKYIELSFAVRGTRGKYFDFFLASPNTLVEFNLDSTADPNPGDARFCYKRTASSDWTTVSIDTLRALPSFEGLGAVINIRKWFFDRYSTGQVLSMVAHEVGVHIVPYLDELMAKLPASARAPADPTLSDPTRQPGPAGRQDHLRVADVNHVDFRLYQGVVQEMMNSARSSDSAGGRATASDLADAYLMDLSTFTATGTRVKTPLNAGAIATKYNDYRTRMGLSAHVPQKTAGQVFAAYRTLYSRVLPVLALAYPRSARVVKLLAVLMSAFLLYWLFASGRALLFRW
jgi:hypothetical protein